MTSGKYADISASGVDTDDTVSQCGTFRSLGPDVKLTTLDPDVYGPSEDSFALADALLDLSRQWHSPPELSVELGCGSGYVITSLAKILEAFGNVNCRLVATDVNNKAILATSATLAAHGVPTREFSVTQVGVELFNPPYVPTNDYEMDQGGLVASWAGGVNGRVVIDRLLRQLDEILSPSGQLLMVTVQQNDPQGIVREWKAKGYRATICLTQRADEELLQIVHIQRPL